MVTGGNEIQFVAEVTVTAIEYHLEQDAHRGQQPGNPHGAGEDARLVIVRCLRYVGCGRCVHALTISELSELFNLALDYESAADIQGLSGHEL
jgi:hypothetical protein